MIADIDIRTKRRMKELNLEDKPEIFEKRRQTYYTETILIQQERIVH